MNIKTRMLLAILSVGAVSSAYSEQTLEGDGFQKDFATACELKTSGRNDYFVLIPGHTINLSEADHTRVQITVSERTREVDGVLTRIVEEREWKDGQLYEVAMNYFAICEETKDVYYFGEDVDFYEDGKVIRHDGAWLAGTNGNQAGLFMPGNPQAGMKYYQELAPKEAMDRAEIISVNESCKTAKQMFNTCIKIKESTPLDPEVTEFKYFAKDIGLVKDDELEFESIETPSAPLKSE